MAVEDQRCTTRSYGFTKESAIAFGDWWESRKDKESMKVDSKPEDESETRVRKAA